MSRNVTTANLPQAETTGAAVTNRSRLPGSPSEHVEILHSLATFLSPSRASMIAAAAPHRLHASVVPQPPADSKAWMQSRTSPGRAPNTSEASTPRLARAGSLAKITCLRSSTMKERVGMRLRTRS